MALKYAKYQIREFTDYNLPSIKLQIAVLAILMFWNDPKI